MRGSLSTVFGFGAEIARLCLVKLAQTGARRGDSEQMSQMDCLGQFETYLQVVNRAISALCKVNQFSEAALVCERSDELRKSLPSRFMHVESNGEESTNVLLSVEAAHLKRRIKL